MDMFTFFKVNRKERERVFPIDAYLYTSGFFLSCSSIFILEKEGEMNHVEEFLAWVCYFRIIQISDIQ